jgi:signal transduction histidine kinase
MPDAPLMAEDVQAFTALGSRRQAYRDEGVVSLLTVPLRIHGQVTGTLVFYYRSRQRLDDTTVHLATALANLAGAAIGTAELYTRESRLRREAEQADRRKDEFLAMLAHELRNPLAPILTSLQVLRFPGVSREDAGRAGGVMERQVQHLSRLIDDLLDVSRLSRGKIRLRTERLDLAGLVRTTAADYLTTARAAGLALSVEAPPSPVWVTGDATRLAQVLDNLLDNAVKFTECGEVAVRLAADPASARALLTVRDTGIGIDPEMLPRVFDPFSQADRSLDRSRGGLGLGLALVKGLAELHGGGVAAASAGLGTGSEFTVRLPLETGAAPAPPASGEIAPDPRRRVLVIEDQADVADSLRVLLELVGHEVRVAYTGPEGLRAAREWRPDAVLSDIGLPGMDGLAVAAALRGDPAVCPPLMIAVSGYGSEEDRARSRAAGFDHHLVKPTDVEELRRLLAAV